jgi:hypothetical protein
MVRAKRRKEKTRERIPTPEMAEPIEETIEGGRIIEEPAVTRLWEKRTEEKKPEGEKPEIKTGEKKPEVRNDSIEISNKLIAAVVIIVVLVAAALYVWPALFPQEKPPELRINQTQFDSIVLGAQRISVIMNITGENENGSRVVMQCGVEISGSMGRLGKNVSNYVFDGGTCVTPEVNTVPISDCSKAMNDFYFIIGYGPDVTRYYDRHAEIEVSEQFTLGCNISRGS